MERAYLGETGMRVSRIILGCGNFGGIGSAPAFFGKGESREEAFAIMDAAWEAGITTFDTADAYGGGRSETWIGDWLKTKGPDVREHVVLSTKTFNPMDEGEDHGLAPVRVQRQLESSLRRLGVERVDMYLTHDWDPDVPVAETLDALSELVREGKVGAIGASNVGGAQLRVRRARGLVAPRRSAGHGGGRRSPPAGAARAGAGRATPSGRRPGRAERPRRLLRRSKPSGITVRPIRVTEAETSLREAHKTR